MKEIKRLVIHTALNETVEANDRCGILELEELEGATKNNPLNWDLFSSLKRSPIQPEASYNE